MKLGLYLRNMGPQSTRATIVACARAAEAAGIDDLWVADHVAIPPDQAEGSGGRYLDPLATLAFLAGATERIGLGTGVLVLPYRPALATAKWVATIQELAVGRFTLGVGVGWMEPEFRAVGVPYRERGRATDATLELFGRCFADDVVESNGQPFLFLPRPPRPTRRRSRALPSRWPASRERARMKKRGRAPYGARPLRRCAVRELRLRGR